MVKMNLNILLDRMMILKKICTCVLCFQKWAHIQEILMKRGICFFFIKDNELLEKYHEIWDKVSKTIQKKFDSEPVYN